MNDVTKYSEEEWNKKKQRQKNAHEKRNIFSKVEKRQRQQLAHEKRRNRSKLEKSLKVGETIIYKTEDNRYYDASIIGIDRSFPDEITIQITTSGIIRETLLSRICKYPKKGSIEWHEIQLRLLGEPCIYD